MDGQGGLIDNRGQNVRHRVAGPAIADLGAHVLVEIQGRVSQLHALHGQRAEADHPEKVKVFVRADQLRVIVHNAGQRHQMLPVDLAHRRAETHAVG